MKSLAIGMAVAYPPLAHAAVWWRAPVLEWLALWLLVCIPLLRPLAAPRAWAWAVMLLLGAILYGLTTAGQGIYALYLPPIVIPLVLLWAFASTLLPGRTPWITVIARASRDSMSERLTRYTDRLTLIWSALFALMAFGALMLAILDQRMLWSLQTNALNYVACGALFVGDHLYRRWRFADEPHPGFLRYLRIVAQSGTRRP